MQRQFSAAVYEIEIQFVRCREQHEDQAVHLFVVFPVIAVHSIVVIYCRFIVFNADPKPRRVKHQRVTAKIRLACYSNG